MNYHDRKELSEIAEQKVRQHLESCGFISKPFGIEYLIPDAEERVRFYGLMGNGEEDRLANIVRYSPDLLNLGGAGSSSFFHEVKHGVCFRLRPWSIHQIISGMGTYEIRYAFVDPDFKGYQEADVQNVSPDEVFVPSVLTGWELEEYRRRYPQALVIPVSYCKDEPFGKITHFSKEIYSWHEFS